MPMMKNTNGFTPTINSVQEKLDMVNWERDSFEKDIFKEDMLSAMAYFLDKKVFKGFFFTFTNI